MQFDNNAQNTLIEGPRQIFQSFSQITVLKTYLISFQGVLCIKRLIVRWYILKVNLLKDFSVVAKSLQRQIISSDIFMINKFVDLIHM